MIREKRKIGKFVVEILRYVDIDFQNMTHIRIKDLEDVKIFWVRNPFLVWKTLAKYATLESYFIQIYYIFQRLVWIMIVLIFIVGTTELFDRTRHFFFFLRGVINIL